MAFNLFTTRLVAPLPPSYKPTVEPLAEGLPLWKALAPMVPIAGANFYISYRILKERYSTYSSLKALLDDTIAFTALSNAILNTVALYLSFRGI